MMDEKTEARINTRLWDRGKVYKGDERIAEVVYALQIVQGTVDGVEQQNITGQVRVVDGKRNLINEGALVLHLNGGRKWEFLASIDMGSGVYNIVGTSRAGLAPNSFWGHTLLSKICCITWLPVARPAKMADVIESLAGLMG